MVASSSPSTTALRALTTDWGDAPAAASLLGRSEDIRVLDDARAAGCRVVAITGGGGLGKSTLARVWAGGRNDFDHVIWLGFKNREPLADALQRARQLVTTDRLVPVGTVAKSIDSLTELLNSRRMLIVLDNLESVMRPAEDIGAFLDGYTLLEAFCARLAEVPGDGMLMLTSREVPKVVRSLDISPGAAHCRLRGLLDLTDVRDFLAARGVNDADEDDVLAFARHHDGNPYAMGVALRFIQFHYTGDAFHNYVEDGCPLPADVAELLESQYDRLSEVERVCLARFAVERVALTRNNLVRDLEFAYSKSRVLAALDGLSSRFLLEKPTTSGFSLQNLLLEYLTERLEVEFVEELAALDEPLESVPAQLRCVPILQALAPRHVRSAQVRTLVKPVAERLKLRLGGQERMGERLLSRLRALSRLDQLVTAHSAGTIINVLVAAGTPLDGQDLSGLPLWSCDFSETSLYGSDMSGSSFRDCLFNSTFGAVTTVTFDTAGSRVFAGTADGYLHAWDTALWSHSSVAAHAGYLRALTYDDRYERVLTVGDDRLLLAWGTDLRPLGQLVSALEPLRAIAVSGDGTLVAIAGMRGLLQVLHIETGEVEELRGHTATVRGLAFDSSGALISACEEGLVFRQDLSNDAGGLTQVGLGQPLWCLLVLPQGEVVVAGQSGRPIKLDGQLKEIPTPAQQFASPVWAMAQTDDSLLASTSSVSVCIYEPSQLRLLRVVPLHASWARAVAAHPMQQAYATGGEDHLLNLIDAASMQPVRSFSGASQSLWAVAKAGENGLAAGGSDGLLHVWRSGVKERVPLPGEKAWIRSLASDALGQLAIATDLGDISLWDGRGAPPRLLGRHPGGQVWSLDWHPTEPLLASAGEDGTVRVWPAGISTRASVSRTVHSHGDWVVSVRFSPDGRLLASGGDDGTILVSALEGGAPTRLRAEGARQLWGLAWTHESEPALVAGGRDGVLRRWVHKDGQWTVSTEAVAGHPLWVVSPVVSCNRLWVAGDEGTVSEVDAIDLSPTGPPLQLGTDRVHDLSEADQPARLAAVGDEGLLYLLAAGSGPLTVLRPDRQYEGLQLSGASGLSLDEWRSLEELGAQARPTETLSGAAHASTKEVIGRAAPAAEGNARDHLPSEADTGRRIEKGPPDENLRSINANPSSLSPGAVGLVVALASFLIIVLFVVVKIL
jgi:WD40 repeat protein